MLDRAILNEPSIREPRSGPAESAMGGDANGGGIGRDTTYARSTPSGIRGTADAIDVAHPSVSARQEDGGQAHPRRPSAALKHELAAASTPATALQAAKAPPDRSWRSKAGPSLRDRVPGMLEWGGRCQSVGLRCRPQVHLASGSPASSETVSARSPADHRLRAADPWKDPSQGFRAGATRPLMPIVDVTGQSDDVRRRTPA